MTDCLSCDGVSVRFGGIMALRDATLSVGPDEIVGLVGPNGAGKSTLFAVLSGLLRPSTGKVAIAGEDVTFESPQRRAARGLARTFQHPELFTGLTVREHLVLAHRAKHARGRVLSDMFTMGALRPPGRAEEDAVNGLVDLLGLGEIAAEPVFGLPLGMTRLVELARALATSPSVLLLDEPSSGLDSSETAQFEATLRAVSADRGISLLVVEHDVDLVMRLCHRVYVLDFGSLIAEGTPQQVRSDPAVRAAYLGEEVSSKEKASLVVAAAPEPVPDAADGAAGLVVEELSVRYGDATALDRVSFSTGAGRALAVLGANGAGKSSLARSVSGLVPAAGGRIVFDGTDITGWAPHRVRRAGLVHLPEGRAIFRNLTVTENLRMAAATLEGRSARKDGVELAFEIFPLLAERRRQPASLLSGGEQQMLSLARALAVSPKAVVADELSLGLAPMMVDAVFDGLGRARQAGVTIVMIEQYVHRALDFADDCLVLQHGTVGWCGPAGEARGDILRHYLGEAMTAAS